MKRLICAVSIAALLIVPVAAMAGTTLYGNARISVNYWDNDDGADENISAQDNVSRIGLKGEYGDAIKAFFHLQVSARVAPDSNVTVGVPAIDEMGNAALISASGKDNDAFGQRFYFAGLKGSFGALSYGRVTNAYKMPGYKMNGKLYDTTTLSVNGPIGTGGASYGLSPMNNGFTPTVVQYVTPSLGGAKINGTLALDGSNNNDHGYIIGASYGGGGIDVGAIYADNGDGNQLPNLAAEGDAFRVYGSYKTDSWKVGLSFEGVDIKGDLTDDKVGYIFGIGSVKVSPKADVIASIGFVDDGPAKGVGGTVGVNYGIVENTEILLSGSYGDLDNGLRPIAVSCLFVHNFSISN
jgi:hypothetical protein